MKLQWIGMFVMVLLVASCKDSENGDTPNGDTDSLDTGDHPDAGDLDAGDADAGEPAKEWENYTFSDGKIAACSGNIAYQKWKYSGEAAATLVLVPGRSDYTDKYHHLIEMFDRPWDIVAFDHYGQGRSDGPRAHADDFDTQHVCDMKKVIDELTDSNLPVAVVAHSMGGFISTRLAQSYPDLADVYVFSAPMYGMVMPLPVDAVKSMAKIAIDNGKSTQPYTEAGDKDTCEENFTTHDCDFYDLWMDDPYVWIGPATYGWLYAAITGFEKLFADVAKLTTPIQIMQAGDDHWVLPEKQSELCDAVSSCSLITFEDAYHELFNETIRADVVAKTVEFIDGVLER